MTHTVITEIVRHGYVAIVVLMILESACLPVPSELVMVLGGALAGGATVYGTHGHLNFVVVGLLGTAGNVVGSLVAWEIGQRGGRPLVERYGRLVRHRHRDLERAEEFFARRGQIAVFFGRVLPVVRTFISFAAGVGRMPRGRFLLLTTLGCLPWTMALSAGGWAVADNWKQVSGAFTPISVFVAVGVVALVVRWYVLRRRGEQAAA